MKNLYIALMLLSLSFSYAQDVAKKDTQKTKTTKQEIKSKKNKQKTVCVHKDGFDGCGPTLADAKQALAMAIEMDTKKKKDSLAKIK
jgi:hypothetical protein